MRELLAGGCQEIVRDLLPSAIEAVEYCEPDQQAEWQHPSQLGAERNVNGSAGAAALTGQPQAPKP
jgi:hypothetical protein